MSAKWKLNHLFGEICKYRLTLAKCVELECRKERKAHQSTIPIQVRWAQGQTLQCGEMEIQKYYICWKSWNRISVYAYNSRYNEVRAFYRFAPWRKYIPLSNCTLAEEQPENYAQIFALITCFYKRMDDLSSSCHINTRTTTKSLLESELLLPVLVPLSRNTIC